MITSLDQPDFLRVTIFFKAYSTEQFWCRAPPFPPGPWSRTPSTMRWRWRALSTAPSRPTWWRTTRILWSASERSLWQTFTRLNWRRQAFWRQWARPGMECLFHQTLAPPASTSIGNDRRCRRIGSSWGCQTGRRKNYSLKSNSRRGSVNTSKRGEGWPSKVIFAINITPQGCYGRWCGTRTCTIWMRSSTLWRMSTALLEQPPPLRLFGERFFSLVWNFLSLWRFPRHWGTSCTCLLPWRRHPGAMSPAMLSTFISTLSWYHYDERVNVAMMKNGDSRALGPWLQAGLALTFGFLPKKTNRHIRLPLKTSQELQMLSNATLNCQETKTVMNSGSQLSEK